MITLGVSDCPSLEGVVDPEAAEFAVPDPAIPCAPKCCPPANDPEAGCWPGCNEPMCPAEPSAAGWFLARESFSWVCEEEGVA